MSPRTIPLDKLYPHPANSNIMPRDRFRKLVAHIRSSDRYPPIIVRPRAAGGYEILDGHHRAAALRKLEHTEAQCVVWEVDDDEALLLLATLNRLEGHDDPARRAALLARLTERLPVEKLVAQLPEQRPELERLLALNRTAPVPQPPAALGDMPVAVHFFLLPRQRDALECKLRESGTARETALLKLLGIET